MTRTDTALPDDPHFDITVQTERVSAMCFVIDSLLDNMRGPWGQLGEITAIPHLTSIILDAIAEVNRINRALEGSDATR